MSKLSISKAWDESKAIAARDGRLIAAVALALFLLPQTVAGVIMPPPQLSGEQAPAWGPFLSLLIAGIGVIGQVAIARLALGPAASVGESISHGLRRAGPAVLALLMFAIPLSIVLIGLLLVLAGPSAIAAFAGGTPAPGLLGATIVVLLIAVAVATRFQMIVPAAAAESGGPVKLLMRSWELSSGHYLRLLAFLLIVLALAVVLLLSSLLLGGILGRIAFGDIKPFTIGALAVALISAAVQAGVTSLATVMLARIYVQLSGKPRAAVPSKGT